MQTTEYSEYTEIEKAGVIAGNTLGMICKLNTIASFSVCSVCSVVSHLPF